MNLCCECYSELHLWFVLHSCILCHLFQEYTFYIYLWKLWSFDNGSLTFSWAATKKSINGKIWKMQLSKQKSILYESSITKTQFIQKWFFLSLKLILLKSLIQCRNRECWSFLELTKKWFHNYIGTFLNFFRHSYYFYLIYTCHKIACCWYP